jgi:hypothetical protein
LIFGGQNELGGKVDDLVALRERIGRIEFEGQASAALGAEEGDLGEEFIDVFDRLERTKGAVVTRLAPAFATRGSRLGRRGRCGGRVGGGGTGRVAGVLMEARGELGHLLLELGNQGLKLAHLGQKGLTARAISIRCAHTPGIRGVGLRFLPPERLP